MRTFTRIRLALGGSYLLTLAACAIVAGTAPITICAIYAVSGAAGIVVAMKAKG